MTKDDRAGRPTKILFVKPNEAPFIATDLELLKKHFEVRLLYLGSTKKNLGGLAKTMIRMVRGVLWSDLTFSWFADAHAKWAVRISRLLGKKSIVVLGGYEVAKVPEIGHGALLNPRLAKTVKYVIEHADKILAVDESLKEEAIRNLNVDGKSIQTLLAGHDHEKFKPSGSKENMVMTIGLLDRPVVKRKGLDVFVQAAGHLRDVRFVLIGSGKDGYDEQLKKMAAPNVEFVGWVDHHELHGYYQRARVYCQLSVSEGLPNALCEAMLCECVPVGTKVCGIPTAMGDTGFYVPVGDTMATVEAIRKALASDRGKVARARIVELFSLEKREQKLVEIVRGLVRK
jgi:glycosyltransferase involved in cell wall biosynthesis